MPARWRAALGAAACLLVAGLVASWPVTAVEVAGVGDGPGTYGGGNRYVMWVPRGTLVLGFRHSVWGLPVEEELELTAAGFRLRRVRASTPEVMAYYQIPGARLVRAANGYELHAPHDGPAIRALTVRASTLGRRVLLAGGRCVPLWQLGERVVIRPVSMPAARALAAWMGQGRPAWAGTCGAASASRAQSRYSPNGKTASLSAGVR